MHAAGLARKSSQSLPSFITVATDRLWELADMVAVIEAWEAEEEKAATVQSTGCLAAPRC